AGFRERRAGGFAGLASAAQVDSGAHPETVGELAGFVNGEELGGGTAVEPSHANPAAVRGADSTHVAEVHQGREDGGSGGFTDLSHSAIFAYAPIRDNRRSYRCGREVSAALPTAFLP